MMRQPAPPSGTPDGGAGVVVDGSVARSHGEEARQSDVAVPAAVDLVDLALKATTAYERPDLGARLTQTPQAPRRPERAGARRRRVQAGQEPAGERAGQRAGLPGGRRHRHGGAHGRAARRDRRRWCSSARAPGSPPERTAVPVEKLAPSTSPRRATPATRRCSPTPRSGCRASCSQAGWCSSTPRASAGSARRTGRPRCRRCPARTPCCWSPTPPRSTPGRSWSSSARR